MNTFHFIRTLAILIALVTCGRATLAQTSTTVDIRTSITLPAGTPVLLKNIATVAGPDADRLSTIVILHADETKDPARTLNRDTLRATLDKAGANWSRTLLRAGATTITFTPSPTATPSTTSSAPLPNSPAPALLPAPSALGPQPSALPPLPQDPRALRTLILNALAEAAGPDTGTDAVTLRTENLAPPDQQLLATVIPPSWKCHIRILGATPGGRTSIKVEAFDADRVALTKTLTVEAMVRREVLVVAPGSGLARDQVITTTDLRYETRLIPVNESARIPTLTMEQFANGVTAAKRRIDAGKPILPADATAVKGAIVVKRGDDVQVSCLAGGIILKSKAKSLGTARDGELVQLQVEGSKKIISARMSGPGKAIIALDPAPPAQSASAAN